MKKLSIIIFAIILPLIITVWLIYSVIRPVKQVNQALLEPDNAMITLDQEPSSLRLADQNKLPEAELELEIKALFFGDMMLDRHVGERIAAKGEDQIFDGLALADFFAGYDLISANLEGAVTDGGKHYAPVRLYDFAFHPDLINGLKKFGFNFFNLANNHFDDQGIDGMAETRENLEKLDLSYSGDADGKISGDSNAILNIKDKKIGLIGLSSIWGGLSAEKAGRAVASLASTTDLIIVNIHWGTEYQPRSNQVQAALAYAMIDAGADIIIGHHPHVIQGVEIYHDRPIFYSLGNFVFDQYFSPETQQSLAVGIALKDKNLELSLHPLTSHQSQVKPAGDEERAAIFDRIIYNSKLDPAKSDEIRAGKLNLLFTD